MLEIRCPACQKKYSWTEEDPAKFCPSCGKALADSNCGPVESISSGNLSPGSVENGEGNRARPIDSSATIAPATKPQRPDQHSRDLGEMVGPYRLVRFIGSGGMGVVWEAIEEATGRRVAVKRLSKQMVTDPESHQRFVREAQIAARISHPNATFIFDAGEQDGIPYIAMELMPGTTLSDQVAKEGPLPIREGVDRMLEAIEGLIAAHELGLIHRDVKPSNCFLTTSGTVKIGDFGLSKSLHTTEIDLTKTGTFMGTPSFSAPEQIRGAELDGRTDVYAVGATLYNLLTGQNLFSGDALQVTAQIVSDEPKPPTTINPGIPTDLERIILKCIEKDPAKRFQDLVELKMALKPFASRGTSLANFGRRLAAFMTDYLLVQTLVLTLLIIAFAWIRVFVVPEGKDAVHDAISKVSFFSMLGTWSFSVGYFLIFEGLFGRTIGKKILGLKVVDAGGQSPGFWRSLIRAFTIPGGFGLTLAFGFYQAYYLLPPADAAGIFVSFVAWFSVQAFVLAICLFPVRNENELRGLQGMLSGTRVLWQKPEEAGDLNIKGVQPTANTIKTMKFGPFESNEMLGTSRLGKVYLAYDEKLHRKIWIVASGQSSGPSQARINLARPYRQRWLAGGVDPENGRWDAIQAVNGLPIQAIVGINPSINWQHYRLIMKQLATELKASLDDGNLPRELSLPQLWVDNHCRAVLLDQRLVNLVADETELKLEVPERRSPECEAVSLLQELADLLYRTQLKTLPQSAQIFLRQLTKKPKTAETIEWATERLEKMSNQLATMDWDSRAGILGSSVGLEFLTYGTVAAGTYLLCLINMSSPLSMRFLTATILSLALPVVFGFWLRGGFVFRFMGINVCDKSGHLAKRLQCAFRSMLAWIPPITFVGFVVLISLAGESIMYESASDSATSIDETLRRNSSSIIIILIWIFSFLSLNAAGLIFALRSPSKGLQDYLSGTVLIPE